MDYTVPAINREFGTVFLGDKNVGLLVVAAGWAKVIYFKKIISSLQCFDFIYVLHQMIFFLYVLQVREQGQQKGEVSPHLPDLLRLEEQAKQQGLGRWNRVCIYFLVTLIISRASIDLVLSFVSSRCF